MSVTLPQFTKTIDDQFVTTWYDIRPDAIDNILLATVVWALLKEKSRFIPQAGSQIITRTIRYGVGVTPVAVSKGDTLPMGVVETETMASWTFRNLAVNAQRDTITDAENSGKFKIKDYVSKRLGEARDALAQRYETDLLRTEVTAETGKNIQSLFDIVPAYANATTGSYGGINRPGAYSQIAATNGVYAPTSTTTNPFWGAKYKALTLPYEVNLISDMKVLFNSVQNNQVAPDILLCDQGLYELYEEFAVDRSQLVKDDTTMLADLGFTALRFKGKALTWSPNIAASNMLMLTSDFIDVVYDPGLWFAMSEWKSLPNSMERVAHIISRMNVISDQLRRHGRLTSDSVT